MPPKVIVATNKEHYLPPVKKRPKPKEWDDTWTRTYWLERDRVLWKMYPESRKEIEARYL